MEVSAGRAIVDVLRAEGVKAVFGIPGGHTLGIYDALYDTPEVRHILVRHEQVAGNMAAGYAQLTGQPGVCCVTAGPGRDQPGLRHRRSLRRRAADHHPGRARRHHDHAQGREPGDRAGADLPADHQMVGACRPGRPHRRRAAPGLHHRALGQAGSGADRHSARRAGAESVVRRLPAGRQAVAAARQSGADRGRGGRPAARRATADPRRRRRGRGGCAGGNPCARRGAASAGAHHIVGPRQPAGRSSARGRRHRTSPHLADQAAAARGGRRARPRLPLRGAGNELARRLRSGSARLLHPGRYRSGRDRPQRGAAACRRRRCEARPARSARSPEAGRAQRCRASPGSSSRATKRSSRTRSPAWSDRSSGRSIRCG